MRDTEEQNITVRREVDVSIKCDECKKEIKNKDNINLRDYHYPYRDYHYPYFEVTIHHHDWGNDSVDSFRDLDFCSLECMLAHMERYYKSAIGTECYDVQRTW